MDASLDDIVRKNTADCVDLLNIRKKIKEEIDPDELDNELDAYMAALKGPSKFNPVTVKQESEDVEMPTQKPCENNCCKLVPKVESKNKSQQWRLGSNGPRKMQHGRVGKNYRKNSGKYIEQGNFTYKYKNGNEVTGIVRNQRYHPANPRRNHRPNQPLTIDINLNELDFLFPYAPQAPAAPPMYEENMSNILKALESNQQSNRDPRIKNNGTLEITF
jgi:hypothetical protein